MDNTITTKPLTGKVAIVTGAGSSIGLGLSMSLALAKAGAQVTMSDIDKESLEESADFVRSLTSSNSVFTVVSDVSNPIDSEDTVKKTLSKFGGLHILVNNAGTNQKNLGFSDDIQSDFWKIPPEAWNKVISVNLGGPFFMSRAAIEHFIGQRWGRIIGITTSVDTMIKKGMAPYGPSKAGHEALVAIMAKELEGSGVTANVLVPGGATNTNLLPHNSKTDRNTLIQPSIMCSPIVWIASEDSKGINGHRFIAYRWDASLPIKERLKNATAPVAWPQLGKQAIQP